MTNNKNFSIVYPNPQRTPQKSHVRRQEEISQIHCKNLVVFGDAEDKAGKDQTKHLEIAPKSSKQIREAYEKRIQVARRSFQEAEDDWGREKAKEEKD